MKKDMRAKIKKAAQQIFKTQGIEKISMRKIAERINYSPTTIYLYYKNKDELLTDILADYNVDFDQKLTAIICSNDPVSTKLTDFLKLYISHGIANRETYKLLNDNLLGKKTIAQNAQERSKHTILRGFVDFLVSSGEFTGNDPDQITLSLWLHCYGVATMAVYRPELLNTDIEDFVDFSVNNIINSFRRNK